jgi:hypothetical protein
MGSWAGDEDRVTTPEEMRTWMARTIWWQSRLDLLRPASGSEEPSARTADAPEQVADRVRRPVRRRSRPVVEA